MQFVSLSARCALPVRLYGPRGIKSQSDQNRAHPCSCKQLHRVVLQLLATLALIASSLSFSGCAGGFQGYKPVAPSISQPASATVQLGQTATFSVTATATGTGPITYQWYNNGVAISGATLNTYTTPPTTASDNGDLFTVTVSSSAGSVTSGPATLTVQLPPPVAKSITPSSATPPYNSSVMLFPTFSGGTAVIGSKGVGSSDITTSAVSGASYPTPLLTSPTTYTLTVTDSKGNVVSTTCVVTPTQLPPPLAKSIVPSSTTPPYNSSVMLVPTFTGGTAVIGSTGVGSSDISTSAVSGASYPTPLLTVSTTYTLTVTDSKGNVVSTTCVVTPTGVTITPISPANQTLAPGQIAFTATASGGATNNLTWSATGGTFSGSTWTSPTTAGTYTITATSVDEPSVSVTTMITLSAPAIVTQPSSQHVCSGSGLVLSVTASYATSYQWSLNGTPIPGATNASYTVSSAAAANAGNYSVTVTNGLGSVTSSLAVVAVGSSITSNPTSVSLYPTQTALFSVMAQGVGSLAYQWYQIPSGGTTGVAISGATSSNYVTPPVDITYDAAQYYAIVTDSCGSLTSTDATLTVTAGSVPPTIITQPFGVTAVAGGAASYSVGASGTPTLTYQWYRIPAGHATGTAVAGATSATYNLPASATTTSNDQDLYYVIVSNGEGQAVSEPAPLAVGNGILLQITGQPVTQYVDVGSSATYQVTAVSSLPLTYQWYSAQPGSAVFTPITGATSSTYTLDSAATTDNGTVFYVVVSNGATSSVTSSSAGLFVGPLAGVPDLCNSSWSALGNAVAGPSCSFQLTSAANNQHGEMVWPTLISTGNIQISFTVTLSNPSALPADGFTVLLADPSLGATPTSLGAVGMGLGAEGIPGLLFALDTYHNAGDPHVPYIGVGRGETALFENPWFDVNTNIPAVVSTSMPISHSYTFSIVQGQMTVTMDGFQLFSGSVEPPPVAYLFITASTGGSYEDTVVSNVSATISVPN
jgi:hypothetical protein